MAGIVSDSFERILLLHTLPGSADALVRLLQAQRLAVSALALSGTAAWPEQPFDGAIVHADALDVSVRSVAYRLKRQRPGIPLVLWSAGSPAAITDIIETGYDLWLPAETPVAGVAAQLKAMHRLLAATAHPAEPETISIRNITIDFQRFEVRTDSGTITLTPTEFKIIAHLARHPGKVVRHAELFRAVHGYDASEQEAKDILKVHIWRLRNKLTAAGAHGDCIVNVRGFGYLLERRAGATPQAEPRSALA
jgi:DNA-binding response OmpR family regulator